MPVEDITLTDISINSSEGGRQEWTRRSVPEQAANYPEARMFGRLPASGLYVHHAHRIRLSNLTLKAEAPDARPVVVCDDVCDLDILGLRNTSVAEGQAVITLRGVRDVFVHGCKAPNGTQAFIQVSGSGSEGIVLRGNDLSRVVQQAVFNDGAVAGSVSSQS